MRQPAPRMGAQRLAAGCSLQSERAVRLRKRRLAPVEELQRLTQLMLKQAERINRAPRRSSLFTGSISQLSDQTEVKNQCHASALMFNNHGLGSLELDNTSDDVLSGFDVRYDSESLSASDVAVMSYSANNAATKQQQQSPKSSELIIPKRLHLSGQHGAQSSTLNNATCTRCLGHRRSGMSRGTRDDARGNPASCDSHGQFDHCDGDLLSEDAASKDDSQELIFKPMTRGAPLQIRPQPQAAQAEARPMPSTLSQSTKSHQRLTTERQVVTQNRTDSSDVDECETGRSLDKWPAIEHQALSVTKLSCLPQQLHQQLCTSSSNCCGGGRRSRGSDASAESLNLVNGAGVLCRPGSIPGINVESSTARGLACSHAPSDIRDEQKLRALDSHRKDSLSRNSKKRVSFSKCNGRIYREEFDAEEEQTNSQQNTDTDSVRPNAQQLAHCDSGADEQVESASNAHSALKRTGGVRPDSRAIFEADTDDAAVPCQQPPQPPPVPPHALRLGDLLNKSATDRTAPDTCSVDCDSTLRFEAGRLYADSSSQHPVDSSLSSADNESNVHLAIGHFYATSELSSTRDNTLAAGYTLNTDSTLRPMDNMDTLSIFSEQELTSERPSPSSKSNACTAQPSVTSKTKLCNQRIFRTSSSLPHKLPCRYDTRLQSFTNQGACTKRGQIRGSNCANSSVNRDYHHHFHRHHQFSSDRVDPTMPQHTGFNSTGQSMSPNSRRCAAVADSSSYVVFQHPPEMSRSSNAHRSILEDSEGRTASIGDISDDSIAFSWVTHIDECAAQLELSMSLDNSSSSQINSRGGDTRRGGSPGKVTFNQANLVEGQVLTLQVVANDVAKIGAVGMDSCVKPSEVRDSAAVSSVAKCVVIAPVSSEHTNAFGSSESDSCRPCLMLEALGCSHKEHEIHGCSISCRSYSPTRRPVASLADVTHDSGRGSLQRTAVDTTPPQAKPRTQYIAPLVPPQPLPRSPRPQPTTMAPQPPPPSATTATAAVEVVRDLLSQVCDPAEATAMTRAIVRGLVCNVESLRSTLVAALMILKDRKNCTGPLAQAIGTANTLDDLIRQVQAGHRPLHLGRRRQHHRHAGEDWGQAADPNSHTATQESDGCGGTTEEEDNDDRDNQKQRQGVKPCGGSAVARRCERSEFAPVVTLPCHTMAHYIVGEQFVEPSLEHRPSLECRPVTTRLVCPELRAVNLAGDNKQKRPAIGARRSEMRQ